MDTLPVYDIRDDIVEIPQAVALDLDRTLGDVDNAMARLYAAAEEEGVDITQIQEAKAATENDGGSFDPLTFVKDSLNEESYYRFADNFVDMEEHPILYPDAVRFLMRLQVDNLPHSIMTYGKNPEWQMLKLDAAGYPSERRIMDHTDKGVEIASHRTNEGRYRYTQLLGGRAIFLAESVVLIDDKAKSFESLPDDCTGLLLQRPGEQLASQKGTVPASVETIASLDELYVVENKLTIVSDAEPETNEQLRQNMLTVVNRPGGFARYLPQ